RSWVRRRRCPRRSLSADLTSTTSGHICGRSSKRRGPGSRWSRTWCSATTRRSPATWRMSRTSERAPCPGTRRRRRSKGVEPRGLTGRNAQVAPVGASQGFCHIDDLAHVVARVRERAMQRLGDCVRLAPDGHRPPEIHVADVSEGREQHLPAILPLGLERSEEHTSELQSRFDLVCRLLLEKKKKKRETQQSSNLK